MADMDCLFMWKAGVSSAEYRVHFMGVNRLSACREFFGVHSWQNGTRCSVVLFPSCLAGFLRFHSCMCLFSFKKLFCDLFLLFFCIVFRSGKREEKWERKDA